jgi:hypothetical protein
VEREIRGTMQVAILHEVESQVPLAATSCHDPNAD